MSEATFNQIRRIVYDKSGIALGENKQALVRSRVAKRMRHLQISDYGQYLDRVIQDSTGEEIQHLLDAISTNVTSFYREPSHFDFMRRVIKEWVSRGSRSLRFWSAASSTGEEPYTIAIEALEAIENRKIDMKILATDISSKVLRISMIGEYERDKVAPVPKELLGKYFTKRKEREKIYYSVNQRIRDLVIFRQFNLSCPPYPIRNPIDIIFCRNVMIYFDRKVRVGMVNEFHRALRPGGYLMVGHAESITGLSNGFKCVKPSIYLRV
jgi:chemotaxis protein methyltransferase CheR